MSKCFSPLGVNSGKGKTVVGQLAHKAIAMFTFLSSVAVAVFLFGSTFLWMTPLFIGPTATGALWTAAQVLGVPPPP